MNIDKISGIGPVYGPKKPGRLSNVDPVPQKKDTIEISEEARLQNLINHIKEESISTDKQKIEEVKEKLKSGFYDNPEVLKKVAENLYDSATSLLMDIYSTKKKS